MKITVTGAGGFLGTHLCEELFAKGYDSVFKVRRKDYDLRHRYAVENLYKQAQPDILIHLAGTVGGIQANRENPGKFFYENMLMGMNLIEGARIYGKLTKFVQIGTVCSYPLSPPIPFSEIDLWNGYPEPTNAPYGIAKKALLIMLQAYQEQYGLKSIYLIPTNLYGPGDNFDLNDSHVIPALIRKVYEAQKQGKEYISIWGDGSASREFLYVKDATKLIIRAMETVNETKPINLGTGYETNIKELVEAICALMKYDGGIVWQDDRPNGQPRRCLDIKLMKQKLGGLTAKTSLMQGLAETIRWYKENVTSSNLL